MEKPDLDEAYVPAASLLQLEVIRIWENLLKTHGIGINDNFFDVGGTSLMAVNLLIELESTFGRRIDPTAMLASPTVKLLAELIQTGDGRLREPIVELQKGDGGIPLFFLHGDCISGGFYCFRLSKHMNSRILLFSVTPHNLYDDQFPTDFHLMALHHLAAIKRAQKHGPYYLAGTCNCGMIAYEIARILESQGEVVKLLRIVSIRGHYVRSETVGAS